MNEIAALSLKHGQRVYFDRGPGTGIVWTASADHVAIAVGEDPAAGEVLERVILPIEDVSLREEEVNND